MWCKQFIRLILFFFFTIGCISCSKNPLIGNIVVDGGLHEQLYAKSVDTLFIDNQKLILETELARDFMPGIGIPSKRRLFATINVVNTDSLPISDKIEIGSFYVINKDQIWISDPVPQDGISIPAFKAHRLCRNGPEWETGIFVDAIVTIKEVKTATIHYLIARNRKINRYD